MSNFIQNIRFKNSEIHKERIHHFVENLDIKEDCEYQCVIKPYKKSKTEEQLGYYFPVVVAVAADWQGLTTEQAHIFLKKECLTPVFFSVLDGTAYEYIPSVKKMNMKPMAEYIDMCINYLGSNGQYCPPPRYKGLDV